MDATTPSSTEPSDDTRTIVLSAARDPYPVVFEMGGEILIVPAWGEIRLVVSGPPSARLRIGPGKNGISVFRDLDLVVTIVDAEGNERDIPGFA